MTGAAADATAVETVCVTGMAWDTALGDQLDEVWRRLVQGVSGIRELTPEELAGLVGRSELPPLRTRRVAPLAVPVRSSGAAERQREVAVRVGLRALADAGLPGDEPEPLLVLATSLGPHADDLPQADAPAVPSLHRWAEDTARGLGLSGVPLSVSTACSSGADAVATAAALIRAGHVSRCLVGGVDLLTAAKLQGHSALGTLSPTALRAFDAQRDGTALGEGAAFLVVESLSAARARGATPYGTVRGWGSSNDAVGLSSPDTGGGTAAHAVRRALDLAGSGPDQVGAVNAHGTGTWQNDEAEANCLRQVFGEDASGPVVFATKGAFGHTLGATGLIESVVVLLALRNGVVPPLPGLREPMPGFPLPLPVDGPMPHSRPLGLSLTLGFGGFNTCLVFEGAEAAPGPRGGDGQ